MSEQGAPQQFISNPVEITAMQFLSTTSAPVSNADAICTWINSNGGNSDVRNGFIWIVTLEGTMRADGGDWIIRGTRGEFYPCKPDVFAVKYRAAASLPKSQPSPSGDVAQELEDILRMLVYYAEDKSSQWVRQRSLYDALMTWHAEYCSGTVSPLDGSVGNTTITLSSLHHRATTADKSVEYSLSSSAKVSGQAEQTVDAGGKFNADIFWLADDPERDCEPEEELEENYAKGQIVEFQAASRMPNFYGFWLPKKDNSDNSEFFFFNTKAEAEAALQESPSE